MVTVGGRFLDMFANLGWLIALIGVGAWLGLGCVAGAHAVMYKRDSRSAAIWLVISFSLPLVGPWLYWGFGINRIERRAVKRIRSFDLARVSMEVGDGCVAIRGSIIGVGRGVFMNAT